MLTRLHHFGNAFTFARKLAVITEEKGYAENMSRAQQFVRLAETEQTYASICVDCFHTVAIGRSLRFVQWSEAVHVCGEDDLQRQATLTSVAAISHSSVE